MTSLTSEIEKEAEAKHDVALTAEESPAVSTSELGTSYAIEVIPASIDHSILAETGTPDDENAVNQSETIEPRATEAEHMFSPAEDKTEVTDGKTSDSAQILDTAEQLPEVTSQEIIQPQSTEVLVTENVLDKENEGEIITSSTELEGQGTAESIEAKDFVAKEVDLTYFS